VAMAPNYQRLMIKLAELNHYRVCSRPSMRTCPFHREETFMRAAYYALPHYVRWADDEAPVAGA
jgi:hypothetical protein